MLEILVASESQEFFTELLFGTGAWLGLVLILAIMFLVAIKVKYSGLIFMVASLFLGIQYFNTIGTSNNLMWCGVLCFSCIPFFAVVSIRGKFDL